MQRERIYAELYERAEAALGAAAGGAAVCTFTKAGIAVPGIKYAEGRWAALKEAERAGAARGGERLVDLRERWEGHLTVVRQRGGSPDWIAYRAGGVEALAELAERLDV